MRLSRTLAFHFKISQMYIMPFCLISSDTHTQTHRMNETPPNGTSNALTNVLTIIKISETLLVLFYYYNKYRINIMEKDAWHLDFCVCPKAMREFIWKCMLIVLQTPRHFGACNCFFIFYILSLTRWLAGWLCVCVCVCWVHVQCLLTHSVSVCYVKRWDEAAFIHREWCGWPK